MVAQHLRDSVENKPASLLVKPFGKARGKQMAGNFQASSLERVSSHPLHVSNAIGSSHESNPPHRICHLRTVPLGYVVAAASFR